ncbi:hypothetical protein LJC44_03100 [Parabacteroides sp. OttesenSCG-928-G06]|nr:hypothetical protein [Parabacteroides sp. OttesenSCG-928-K15]MDL2282090.1 hypothetical protein [Parabacteroides sp. OttesenSCG-928-G06]
MKKNLFLVFLLIASTSVFAQGHEFRVGINSGYSFFRGESSESSSFVNAHGTSDVYTNSPLGKKFTLSYGISANYKYVTNRHFIIGAEIAYEDLRTKVDLESYYGVSTQKTEGRTYLNNHFLNASPFIGYRIPVKNMSLDIIAGVDIAYSLDVKEYGKYKETDGKDIKFTCSRKDSYIEVDIRPRLQVNANYKKYTLFAGASVGLKDYYEGWTGGSPEAYMNTIRIGIQYRIF